MTDRDACQLGDVAFATFFVGGPWATGLALRLRGDLAESNASLKLEQEEGPGARSPRSGPRSPASCTTSSRTRSR